MADCVDIRVSPYPEGHEKLHEAILAAKKAGLTIQILAPTNAAP